MVLHVLCSPAAGTMFQLLPVGREGVPSCPRHVQSCSTDYEHLLNVESQTVPSPRRGGTEEEGKRSAASERAPLSLFSISPRRG